ncbi:DUF2975 domain-containing protein [Oleiharenicola lentus]|uniref:DUF2975 domain-containing protein n=1 Tax=Oleiharenicola lentus TaxID=2508720 RepID=UPI003F669E43
MKNSSAFLFQIAVVVIALGTLALMLGEPHFEGRNAHATTFEIYFNDPLLAYAYAGSIPFFVALYRAFGLFGHVRQTGKFSRVTVDALRAIKWCALALIVFVTGGVGFIMRMGDQEDRTGAISMCFFMIVASSVVATAAALLARNLKNTLEARSG